MKNRILYTFGLIIITAISVIYTAFYSYLNTNDKFVTFAIILFLNLAVLIYLYLNTNKVIKNSVITICLMFVLSFALVPFYNVFCDVAGLNGKIDLSIIAASPKGIDTSRTITVEFVVNYNKEMPWDFKPQHTILKMHPGELARTAYYARNLTKKSMVAQAIPSISPAKASKHFKKLECFCFDNTKLGPGESSHLSLQFYLDPEIPKDVKRLTLAYTLFDISKEFNNDKYKG